MQLLAAQKYRCRCGIGVRTAAKPVSHIKGGRYSMDFAVDVAVDKYINHLPLDRQRRMMGRAGLEIDSFTIEENFRDSKDPRFGFGMSASRISTPERRDRLFLISALAVVLLTLLGAAGEEIGIDRYLKVNTSKRRQLSLLRQGSEWYALIPMMETARLRKLMTKFGQMIQDHALCRRVVGVV